MKSRLAKKIIKASDFYGVYRSICRHKRRKRYPYWWKRWAFRTGWMFGSENTTRKHSRVLYWLKGYDMRLDEALRRQSQYARKIQDDVEAKQMELKRIRLHKMLEWAKAQQNVGEAENKH